MSGDLLLTNLPYLQNESLETNAPDEYAEYGQLQLTNRSVKQQPQSNIAAAAVITARARIKLHNALRSVMNEGGRILYCDTDSVIAAFAQENPIENRLIGEVYFDTSKPDTCLKKAIFIAPKTYGLITSEGREIIKIKGAQAGNITYNALEEAFTNKTSLKTTKTSMSREGLDYRLNIEEIKIETDTYNKRI